MRVQLVIGSHIVFKFKPLKKVDPKCFVKIQKAFTHKNSNFYKLQNMGYPTTGVERRIRSYKMTKDEMFVSRGGLRKLKKILRKHGHKVTISDERLEFPPVDFRSQIKLRHEQKEPVNVMVEKTQGLVRGPCSSGKTVMLLAAIAKAKQPALVLVWDTNHQKQWIAEIKTFFKLGDDDIGGCGGIFTNTKQYRQVFGHTKGFSKRKFGKINVCMQQSMWRGDNRDFYAERCGLVAADEVQRFAARTFQESINPFPAKYRLGVSANERRKDNMQFLVYDSFGQIIHEIDDLNVGSRLKAKIYLIPTKFSSDQFEWNNNWTMLQTELSEDTDRNKLILHNVRRSVAKGRIALILTERRSHALFLRFALKDLETGFLIGKGSDKEINESDWPDEWKKFMLELDHDKEFVRVKRLGEEKKIQVVIATKKGDVGISIKTLDHLHITTPTGNDIERFNQQKGRVERDYDEELTKKFGAKFTPRVFYYWDVKMDKLREAGNKIIKTYPGVSVLKLKVKNKNLLKGE